MRYTAVVKDRKDNLLEKKNFTSRVKMEDYLSCKYGERFCYDEIIEERVDFNKVNKIGLHPIYKEHTFIMYD